ncbi:transcriptional regulator [Kerstersia gyiorum]|uniref:transcriptional regulator n=1 Tax=Kerstersia gyiorum TaxID=206506 RepID=UPI00209FC17B|nr:helix-turn-helix domain-containing protein [Kerstersia gyiorum]MCP1679434.1 DNA-binding transcriptional regulator YdaS (Cro superfamily) [Kerstersia gyiorum]MCP1823937.1 DNA-binding transcriptional regulator YdaS (Cro superfamily) [Kerstersia gyiorum]MCP1827378.1 DNA-binding transcriptional regulator YdaS (Cro superfamily) [Kerstersia gyiorum]MCW2448973.1 DNA-binding transcriptional regulator YdaS (Cro superfamily) [Kerstersia gyiorum]
MNAIELAISVLGSASSLARILGVTPQAVCFWRDGKRSIPIEHCAAIERATNGAVTRKDLRPDDWHRIWPELAHQQAAAAPVEAEAVR